MGELGRITSQGTPDGAGIRATMWKFAAIGYLPPDRALWPSELAKKRSQYKHFKEELLMDPNEDGPEMWSRFNMQANGYLTMTSNIVESVNAVTKAAKNYPIVVLMESLRQTVQSWFCKNRDIANSIFMKLSTKHEKLIREMSADLKNMRVSHANQTIFSVADEGSTFVVDIEQRTCTYRMLQIDQIPCPHTLAVIATTKRDPYDYCLYFYTREAYMNAYQDTVTQSEILMNGPCLEN